MFESDQNVSDKQKRQMRLFLWFLYLMPGFGYLLLTSAGPVSLGGVYVAIGIAGAARTFYQR